MILGWGGVRIIVTNIALFFQHTAGNRALSADALNCGIHQMASIFAPGHTGGWVQHYMAPNFLNCLPSGSYRPRLPRRDECYWFFFVGLFFYLAHLYIENSHPGLEIFFVLQVDKFHESSIGSKGSFYGCSIR